MTCIHRIGKEWNLACAGLERFGFQRLNLKNFANGNSINAEQYFFAVFTGYIYVNYSAELDVYHNCRSLLFFSGTYASEIRATLYCCKTNNDKLPTVFNL